VFIIARGAPSAATRVVRRRRRPERLRRRMMRARPGEAGVMRSLLGWHALFLTAFFATMQRALRRACAAVYRAKRALTAIAALVAIFFVSVAQAQPTEQMTLPGVTVTAPPFVPLYMRHTPGDLLNSKAYQRNPYFGNNRVEEEKFTPVACSDSIARVAPASTGSCLEGYHLIPGPIYGIERPSSSCRVDHDVTIYDLGDLSVEADVFVFDPYMLTADAGFPPKDCYVAGYSGYDQEDFQDMNRITRRGTNWHHLRGKICNWQDLSIACQAKSIEFSYGPHHCIAVRRPGPRWEGGFVWMLTASVCRTDTASLRPDDVARALAALQIRTYDPVGNIARPPK
jgi:hypothetical protein